MGRPTQISEEHYREALRFKRLLYGSEFQLNEDDQWIQKAIKHPKKLSSDLGIKKGERISDLSPSTVLSYAAKSPENKKRVVLARTLFNTRKHRTKGDLSFWKAVTKGLKKLNKSGQSHIKIKRKKKKGS